MRPSLSNPRILLRQQTHLLPLTIHKILGAEVKIATSLEQAAELKRPRDTTLAEEEIRHFEDVAHHPIDEHTHAEALAAARLGVLPNLRQRQDGFDAERNVALHRRVRGRRADEQLQNRQRGREVGQEVPVGAAGAPLPEIVRP